MMYWTILTLVFMVAMGGFLSYYGDLQGRRWGKKRVSWFGLRPKHTAILITSLTGSVIVILSIATVLLAAPAVRDIALRGERAIRESKRLNKQLEEERAEASEKLKETRMSLNDTKAKFEDIQSEYQKVCVELSSNKRSLDKLNDELSDLLNKNVGLQKESSLLARSLESERRTLDKNKKKNTQLASLNRNAERVNTDLGKQNLKQASENAALERKNSALQEETGSLTARNKTLLAEAEGLQKAKEALERANQTQLEANNFMLKRAYELNRQIDSLQSKITELTQRQEILYAQMAGEKTTFLQTYNALRQGRVSLRAGEPLARRIVAAQTTLGEAKRQLLYLLDEASGTALRHGAARGDNDRAVRIVSKRLVTAADTQTADEPASLAALADVIAGSDEPIGVMATVVSNSVAGEQAMIELTTFAVRSTFRKGNVIASCVLDTTQQTERLVEDIVRFLQRDVRDAALKAGTLPQTDLQTGAQEVGFFGPGELVALTDKVRRMGGKVELKAVAAGDLLSAEPLQLEFKLGRPRSLRQARGDDAR